MAVRFLKVFSVEFPTVQPDVSDYCRKHIQPEYLPDIQVKTVAFQNLKLKKFLHQLALCSGNLFSKESLRTHVRIRFPILQSEK